MPWAVIVTWLWCLVLNPIAFICWFALIATLKQELESRRERKSR